MQDSKIFFCFLFFLTSLKSAGQEEFSSQPNRRGDYAWVIYAGSGAGYYVSSKGAPAYLHPTVSNFSHISTLRLMWHPDHLLKVGIETGNMTFYSYEFAESANTRAKVKLKATPLLVEWTMAVTKRLNLFGGCGMYFLRSNLDYRGTTTARKLSIGWMAAGSYIHPLSANTGLGTEVKWMTASETSNGLIALQLQLVWKFLRW